MALPQGQGHLEWLGTVILWPAPSECPREESGYRWGLCLQLPWS